MSVNVISLGKWSALNARKRRPGLPAQPNASLISGLECLRALAGAERPVGSRELARLLGLEPTRANRLLGTLASMGLAEKTAARRYVPGPGLHVLAAISLRGSRLLTAALPHLEQLQKEVPDCAVALGSLWRRQVVYLFFAAPGSRIEASIASRSLYPAEKSSIGLTMLASRPADEVATLYGAFSRRELDSLTRTLATVRKQGWALVDSVTLGVPIGSPPVAGLALSGRITARRAPGLVARLKQTAGAIARDLAH